MKAKLGIIGYRNHAGRLISICEKFDTCQVVSIYHPTKSYDDKRFTNVISDLLSCDAVIIASPNNTHFYYINELLQGYKGYIFCEKPPVTSIAEVETLANLPSKIKEKIFFNFNYRFGKLHDLISNSISCTQIGKIVSVNFVLTHGFAFKEEYLNSWRSDGTKNLHNILDTLSIHHLDLCNFIFGKPHHTCYFPTQMSQKGTTFDTCNLLIEYGDGKTVSILNSYATPYINEVRILGTNGIIDIRNNHITVNSPRDTFDKKGFFTSPPSISDVQFQMNDEYEHSLINSFSYFLSHVTQKTPINLVQFQTSLETNLQILKLHNKLQ